MLRQNWGTAGNIMGNDYVEVENYKVAFLVFEHHAASLICVTYK